MTSRMTPPLQRPLTYHPRPSTTGGGRMSVRERVYRILEQPDASDTIAKLWNVVIVGAIAISTLALIAETVESIDRQLHALLRTIEFASLGLFGAEYVLRLWA